MRSIEEIKHVIESLEADIERVRGYYGHMREDIISEAIRNNRSKINALRWVILERTTWL